MSWELSLAFKATVLLGVALAAVGLAGRMRASRRHLLLASSFAALIALPVAATLIPAVAIPIPIANAPDPTTNAAASLVVRERAQVSPPPSHGARRISASSAPSTTTILRGFWLFGAASILAVFGGSLWSLYRVRRSAVPWITGQTMAAAIAKEAGLNRSVTVIVHERTAVPATTGFLRPVILLPSDARHWTEPDLRRVFIHEIEHIRRGDWWIHLAAQAVCILYWFHPLVWIAWRQLAVEAERACDDAVVTTMDRADYADQLVTLATRLSSPPPRLMVSMASRSDLSTRVTAILNPSQQRGRAGTVAAAAIIGIVAIVMGSVASLQAVAGRQQPAPQRRTAAQRPTVSRAEPATPTAQDVSRAVEPLELMRMVNQVTQPPARAVDADITPYVIGHDDALTIAVWRQPELSVDVLVRPDGKISLPLVGDVQAAGLTSDRLRQTLVEAYKRFVQDPGVTVIVRQISSRKVYIVGSVVRPGVYQLADSMTVLHLIATAGGLADSARKDAIVIVRRVDGKNVSIPFDYAAFVAGDQLDQNILLRPGDTVVVP
jgi:polysaccharide export outer membrane protein